MNGLLSQNSETIIKKMLEIFRTFINKVECDGTKPAMWQSDNFIFLYV